MAGSYRQIHTKIWTDDWFLDLTPEHKLLFIYLFSNARSNLSGLYDLPLKVASFESGLSVEAVKAGLERFAADGKVLYEEGWIWIKSLLRYNATNLSSVKIRRHIQSTIEHVPDIPLKRQWIEHYNSIVNPRYPIDTLSIPYGY